MVSLANSPATDSEDKTNNANQFKLALTSSLQTSLDLYDTLANFYKTLPKVLPCGGMSYCFESQKLLYTFGNESRHQVTYNMHTNDTKLGSVTFFRSKKFVAKEIEQLEALIGILIYPLRNALLYREALEKSLRDGLTRVGNRAGLELTLKRELKLSIRTGDPLSVLVIDIDFFKKINDFAGHSFGDKMLCQVAKTISDALRQTDQVFRFGGEEFVVLLSGTNHKSALVIAERIRQSVMALETKFKGKVVPVTISVGVASAAENDTRDKLIHRADSALFIAKDRGRNCVVSANEAADAANSAIKAG